MKAIEDMSKEELLNAILFEDDISLYQSFEEDRLLGGNYTEEELRSTILAWIVAAPESF